MEINNNEEIKTRGKQIYEYIIALVDGIMAKEQNRDIIMASVTTGVIAFFRLSPVGAAATTIIPLIIKQVVDQRYKAREKEEEDAASQNN